MASNDSNLRWESGSPLLGGVSGDQNSWVSPVRDPVRERVLRKRTQRRELTERESNEIGERRKR